MSETRDYNSSMFPAVTYKVFFFTLMGCLFATVALFSFGPLNPYGHEGTVFDRLTYYFDPILAHLFGLICVAGLIWLTTAGMPVGNWTRLRFSLSLPLLVLLVTYVMGQHVLKPSFAYYLSLSPMRTPWLTAILDIDRVQGANACPSGFVLRQMFLFLTGIVFYATSSIDRESARPAFWTKRILLVFLTLSVLFVGFSRIYRRFHTPYDVAIAIAVSCYLFWFVYYLCGIHPRRLPDDMAAGVAAATFVFVPAFISCSKEPRWWVFIGALLLVVLGFTRAFGHDDRKKV